ncbi:MAG: formylglycine-generating enzyme family protein, partial [Dysgonamonadaceae bacterium]|nr:formylglycine-generating enzyme family protein [Dysgonamonadaceae bacterium]
FTKCVETWNGSKWIQTCPPEGPAESPEPLSAVQCVITPKENSNPTYIAIFDPDAKYYEFFLKGVSQGVQSNNSITFKPEQDASDVTVKYYYSPEFLKPKMIDVEGSDSWYYGEPPNATANVTIDDFKMSRTEITQAQFEYVMGKNPSDFQCGGNTHANTYANQGNATSTLPVEYVNWYQAITYCNKLSIIEGKQPCYTVSTVTDWENLPYDDIPLEDRDTEWDKAMCDFSQNGYRLPTESEWEYAARGGKKMVQNQRYSGSDILCDVAWYTENNNTKTTCNGTASGIQGTKPVAKKIENELELCDMSGNVLEWCWNWYSASGTEYPAATPTGKVESIGSTKKRVIRGGYWISTASYCPVSYRDTEGNSPYERTYYRGFRVAASIIKE